MELFFSFDIYGDFHAGIEGLKGEKIPSLRPCTQSGPGGVKHHCLPLQFQWLPDDMHFTGLTLRKWWPCKLVQKQSYEETGVKEGLIISA